MSRYFETSALLPYYRPEPLSEACERLLLEEDEDIYLSALVDVEVASAVARLVRMGELQDADAEEILSAFADDIARASFRYVDFETPLFARAYSWLQGRETALRTLDALHMAAAAEAGATLVTADGTLGDAAERFGVACLRVTSDEAEG